MHERITADIEDNPAQFIAESIKSFIKHSPDNCFKEIDGGPIFEEPLVGFADGDDPLFVSYKDNDVIGEFHLTPREALVKHLAAEMNILNPSLDNVSVVAWILPMAKSTRVSNRVMTEGPSLRWNHGRWHGQVPRKSLGSHVVSLLRERGYHAVAPGLASFFKSLDMPNGKSSVWSERHIAYAAGLGTFSLTDALITPKGLAMHCGSVVTSLKLPPSPRPYANHRSSCQFYSAGTCGLCALRCPVGAITAEGHDKIRCRDYFQKELMSWLDKTGYIGKYAGCGLCMTGVPCEAKIPTEVTKRFIP